MKVGSLRRIGSFILDIIPIFAVLSILFTLFVGDLIKPEGYDLMLEDYGTITTEYNDLITTYQTQLDNEEITQEEYQVIYDDLIVDYNEDTTEHIQEMLLYFQSALIYYISSFTLLYYMYSLLTKGHTLGRKMLRIELNGKITWWTLLLREVIWKTGYYMLTLLIGGVILDILMINFSAKKQAPRDYITGITVKFEGADYPF